MTNDNNWQQLATTGDSVDGQHSAARFCILLKSKGLWEDQSVIERISSAGPSAAGFLRVHKTEWKKTSTEYYQYVEDKGRSTKGL